jgi:hypothetical protein
MSHAIYRVTSFTIVGDYRLCIRFNDGVEQTIDFRPVLAGKVYRPLRDLSLFNQVRIDPEIHTLAWPNGADFDPATLHDWPDYADAWINRAKQWDSVSV